MRAGNNMLLRQSKWRIMRKKRFVFIYYLILDFVHQSNCGLYGHGSYLNYITDLCFGIDTDSLLIMSASVVYQNDWHAGMHWRNCISNLHRLIFVKLNMPFTKVCVSLYLSPHSISCVQPFHSSLFLPLLLIVVLLMDEPSVIRSLPFMLGLFLAPRVPGWGDAWKWGLCCECLPILAEKEWKKTEGVL